MHLLEADERIGAVTVKGEIYHCKDDDILEDLEAHAKLERSMLVSPLQFKSG